MLTTEVAVKADEKRDLEDHLVALPGGRWALWKTLVLRSAGFSCDRPLELASEALAVETSRLLELEEHAADQRQRALADVDRALDLLREEGAWDDKTRRKPLLKALRVLARGKLPTSPWAEGAEELVEAIRVAEARVEEQRERFGEVWEVARSDASRQLQQIARWDLFREAVTWQNRNAVHTALAALDRLEDAGKSRGSQQRQHEELVASYLQRYSVKNDTIGFFGPVAWSTFETDGPAVTVDFGDPPLARREVYFENWAIDALAKKLARTPGLRPWLVPRLRTCHVLDGNTLLRAVGAPITLSAEDSRLVRACDGVKTAHEVLDDLLGGDPAEPARATALRRLLALTKKRLLTWGLEIPLELYPERTLRRLLDSIGDEGLRGSCLAALDELEEARARVAAAAGDPQRLDDSLRHLEEVFSRRTEQSAHRNQGQTYAGRGVVYEDCRRQLEVRFGPEFLDRLGPPLTASLQAGRWMAGEVARRMRLRMVEIWQGLAQRAGEDSIPSSTFYGQVMSALFLKRERDPLFDEVEAEYQRRWAEVLAIDPEAESRRVVRSAEEVAAKVETIFHDLSPTWQLTRHFSPDVMIAADGDEAIRRGDFLAVLGEVHTSNTMFSSCFVSQHPDPIAFSEGLRHDVVQEPVIVPFFIKENWMQRINISLPVPEFYRFDLADSPPGSEIDCTVLPAAAVVIEKGSNGLVARTRDGLLSFDPLELFCGSLNTTVSGMINHILPGGVHLPRVEVGALALSRERWSFGVDELEFYSLNDPLERYLAIRRWAQEHGMPRFSFYKVSSERKPFYVDFDSPIYVDLFAKMVRDLARDEPENGKLGVSEMLPRTDQTWLADGGDRFTCELRIAALDLDEGERSRNHDNPPLDPGRHHLSRG